MSEGDELHGDVVEMWGKPGGLVGVVVVFGVGGDGYEFVSADILDRVEDDPD